MLAHLLIAVAKTSLSKSALLSTLILLPTILFSTIENTSHKGFGQVLGVPVDTLEVESVVLEQQKIYTRNQATQSLTRFLGAVNTTAQYSVTTYLLKYNLELEDGSFSTVHTEVFVPNDMIGEMPSIIYGPGTTGLDDRCAASREPTTNPRLGNYENQMVAMASQGFLVLMPNYEGLDNSERTHQYFVKDNEARSMLGAGLAIKQVNNQFPNFDENFVLGGYSQGGHASFSAIDLHQEMAPSLKIAGVFGHGPTTDTQDLLRNNPNLAPYFAYTYQKLYSDFDPTKMFQVNRLYQVDRAPELCVNEAFAFNSANISNTYTQQFGQALRDNTVATKYPNISNRIDAQDAGTIYTDTPTLILQGTGDPIVTIEDQVRFADSLCQRKIPVELKTYQYVHHFQTRQKSFWDTLNWINKLSIDKVEAGYCINS